MYDAGDYAERHQATQQIMRWFSFNHLPDGKIQKTSEVCYDLADAMVACLKDGPELTAGLRKLLEAKDAFVRAAIGED